LFYIIPHILYLFHAFGTVAELEAGEEITGIPIVQIYVDLSRRDGQQWPTWTPNYRTYLPKPESVSGNLVKIGVLFVFD
jgi:hypothetical protein